MLGLNLADLLYVIGMIELLLFFFFFFFGWGYGGLGVISFLIIAACYARFA